MKESDISRIIEMAWEDRTPFDAIFDAYGLSEREVKALMKSTKIFFVQTLEEKGHWTKN